MMLVCIYTIISTIASLACAVRVRTFQVRRRDPSDVSSLTIIKIVFLYFENL